MTDDESLLMLTETEFQGAVLLAFGERITDQEPSDEQLDRAMWWARRMTQRRVQEGMLRRYAEELTPSPHATLADGREVRDMTAGELGLCGKG